MTMPEHRFTWTSWRKTSYSGLGSEDAQCVEVAWRKSSYSTGADHDDSDCVEVAFAPDAVAVRDSKNPAGPVLTFSSPSFAAFLRGTR